MKYLGIFVAFITGVNTEFFASRGFWGIMAYTALIVISVALAMIKIPKRG